MTFTEPTACHLCGNRDRRDLAWRLVHWKVSEPGMSYANVTRCRDDRACRARVEGSGRPWPLVERAA